MRRRDQPWAANCCMLFCSFTLRTFAIVPADLPYTEHSAETNRRLKVGNLESVKRDHFRPEVVPFQRPLTWDHDQDAEPFQNGKRGWPAVPERNRSAERNAEPDDRQKSENSRSRSTDGLAREPA